MRLGKYAKHKALKNQQIYAIKTFVTAAETWKQYCPLLQKLSIQRIY